MVCQSKTCIYEKDFVCTLPEIVIDDYGACMLRKPITEVENINTPELKAKYEIFLSRNTTVNGVRFIDLLKSQK